MGATRGHTLRSVIDGERNLRTHFLRSEWIVEYLGVSLSSETVSISRNGLGGRGQKRRVCLLGGNSEQVGVTGADSVNTLLA